ncbi:MAG: hypothetical protein R3D84_18055 [Paracoccaceae bacterium]
MDHVCANSVAKAPGRTSYTQLLNTRGGIRADPTVARLAKTVSISSPGPVSRTHDLAWIADHLPAAVTIRDVTEDWEGTLSLMGPKAREVLAKVTDADVTNAAFPFSLRREISITGAAVRALRITYVGELGWELHVPWPRPAGSLTR